MMKIESHNIIPSGSLLRRKSTKEIILHCSATPEGKDYSVETIDKWHKGKGWSCIGYHYVIYRDGSIHRGRPEQTVGAHCQGHNSQSIGVCYIGGLDELGKNAKDTRTDKQKEALLELVRDLLGRYKLSVSRIHCHNEYARKSCPSFCIDEFRKEYILFSRT